MAPSENITQAATRQASAVCGMAGWLVRGGGGWLLRRRDVSYPASGVVARSA